jgi:hypothetical protein
MEGQNVHKKIKQPAEGAMAECICPVINDAEWDLREHRWAERYFYQRPLRCFFRVPLRAERTVRELANGVKQEGCLFSRPLQLLFRDTRFQGALLAAIEKPAGELPPAVVTFTEAYWLTILHRGPYRTLRRTVGRLHKELAKRGKKSDEIYFWHVTCPACRNERGGDKTVVFARTT